MGKHRKVAVSDEGAFGHPGSAGLELGEGVREPEGPREGQAFRAGPRGVWTWCV